MHTRRTCHAIDPRRVPNHTSPAPYPRATSQPSAISYLILSFAPPYRTRHASPVSLSTAHPCRRPSFPPYLFPTLLPSLSLPRRRTSPIFFPNSARESRCNAEGGATAEIQCSGGRLRIQLHPPFLDEFAARRRLKELGPRGRGPHGGGVPAQWWSAARLAPLFLPRWARRRPNE
jgi:hypothetical protein